MCGKLVLFIPNFFLCHLVAADAYMTLDRMLLHRMLVFAASIEPEVLPWLLVNISIAGDDRRHLVLKQVPVEKYLFIVMTWDMNRCV
jgi:hypothetical protein